MLQHLYMEPYLDKHCKQYKTILTLNEMPEGPLAQNVVRIVLPRVSEFVVKSPECKFAILKEGVGGNVVPLGEYMEADKLPQLMSFLLSNGYKIDYQMSKLLKQHSYGTGHIVCSFTYTN